MCPYCRQDAPLVYRGVIPYCTACGAIRAPLANRSVNLAGKPSKVTGAVTRGFGWAVLVIGAFFSLIVGLVPLAVGSPTVALALFIPFAFVTLVASWMLLRGGKKLATSGATMEKQTREQAVLAIAAVRGGVVNAWQIAEALRIRQEEAAEVLERMAKEQPDVVTMDVDENGGLYFRFANAPWYADSRYRVSAPPEQGPRVAAEPAPGNVIDAELVEEPPPAPRAYRRSST